MVGTMQAMIPAGLPYLTMPFSGSSSMMPTLFWRSASRSTPRIFIRLPIRLTASPSPLSAMPIVDQPRERPLVGDRPGHRLAQPVDARLVVGLDDRERLAARARTPSSSSCCCSSVIGFFVSVAGMTQVLLGVSADARNQRAPTDTEG